MADSVLTRNAPAPPVLLVVLPSLSPYRMTMLRDLALSLPAVALRIAVTLPRASSPWSIDDARQFMPDGPGGSAPEPIFFADPRPSAPGMHEYDFGPQWVVSSRVAMHIARTGASGVIVLGHSHVAHARVVAHCRKVGIPCVLSTDASVRSPKLHGLGGVIARKFQQRTFRAAGAVAVHGQLGRLVASRGGVSDAQIFSAPINPHFPDFQSPSAARIVAASQRYGLDASKTYMLFSGRLIDSKRPDMAIDAFADASAARPELSLVIAGDGPLLRWLRFRVPRDLRHRVIFTGFISDPAELGALCAHMSVSVVPSEFEPWGCALTEAAAAGMALIASDVVGAATELVVPGQNGFIVPMGDRGALSDALLACTQPGKLAAMRARTREIFARWHSSNGTINGLHAALRAAGGSALLAGGSSSLEAVEGLGLSEAAAPLRSRDLPTLALVGGGLIPYRAHLNRRIMRELPQFHLKTLNSLPRWFYPTNVMDLSAMDVVECDLRPAGAGTPEGGWRHQWRVGGRIISHLREHDLAAVICNGYNHWGHLRVMLWCKRSGIACLLNVDSNAHGDLSRGVKRALKHIGLRAFRPLLQSVTVFGRLGVDYFLRYGFDRRRIFISPYEPDYREITEIPPQVRDQLAAEYDLGPDRKRLVFCGRLIAAKRPDLALKAFLAIAAERPELDFVLIGDGPLRAELQALVPAEMTQRVRFLGYFTDPQRIAAIYRLSHIFVLPSDYEPWALVVNEAAAAGCALIATYVVGAANELIVDGENGHIIKPGDLEALKHAILRCSDPANLTRYQQKSVEILAWWRDAHDPVDGLIEALGKAGVRASRASARPAIVRVQR